VKLVLLCPTHFKEAWFIEATKHYEAKVKTVFSFEFKQLKSKAFPREQFRLKLAAEEEAILHILNPTDKIIALDEQGERLSTKGLAQKLEKLRDSLPRQTRLIFIVGGAYGLSENLKKKSHLRIKLSDLTLSHPIALVVILEQLYRVGTLIKGIPYHNP
jgi:23S rRNA (pseudouridine1915-N3)-methyltransferase